MMAFCHARNMIALFVIGFLVVCFTPVDATFLFIFRRFEVDLTQMFLRSLPSKKQTQNST